MPILVNFSTLLFLARSSMLVLLLPIFPLLSICLSRYGFLLRLPHSTNSSKAAQSWLPQKAFQAVNANNLTALSTLTAPSWVYAPDYSGTSNILYSCLPTLVACIYTAIHLNVPEAHQSKPRL